MPLGYGLLWFALALTVAANFLFTRAQKATDDRLSKFARFAAVMATFGVIAASVYLSYLIWNHQFQVAYVAEYSAKRSSPKYLFAAFWGGQEGSILLWTLWTTVLGAFLAFQKGDKTAKVWPIFGIIQVFLLGFLLIKCPFALGKPPFPLDGRGLNPTLENPWMVIHPPILFLGFSSTVIPFVWAIYGLLYRDWDGWIKPAFPAALFSFATLGFGIALGGFWAYETLGWGGFWAWDPVENSSLVPWLLLTALLHGIAVQRANGGYRIANFVLGYLPFAAMFYGTFLTRTGLLDGFSVHAFSTLGKDGFYVMEVGVLASFFVSLAMVVWRGKGIPKRPSFKNILSREFGLLIASWILGILGLCIGVGMSAPLITKIWLPKGADVKADFYNHTTIWVALAMTLLMAVTPYFAWRNGDTEKVMKRLWPAYAAAILLTFVVLICGSRSPLMLLLFATAIFAFIANLSLAVPRLKKSESRKNIGGFLAHMGAALLLAGIACLVTFGKASENVMLLKNRPVDVMGYTFTYQGMTSQPWDHANGLSIRVEKNGHIWQAAPIWYFAAWNGKDTLITTPPAILPNPYQVHSWTELLPWNHPIPFGDLYIAWKDGPASAAPMISTPNKGFSLAPGESRDFGDYRFKFINLDTSEAAAAVRAQENDPKFVPPISYIKALVAVTYKDKTEFVTPQIQLDEGQRGVYTIPASIPGPDGVKVVLQLQPPTDDEQKSRDPLKQAHFQTYNAPDLGEAIAVDVSTKPMISFVWLGTLLYTIGGLIAWRRRARQVDLFGNPTA